MKINTKVELSIMLNGQPRTVRAARAFAIENYKT